MADVIDKLARREWLACIARGALLGGLSGLSLNLIVRAVSGGCVRAEPVCQDCALLTRCRLPGAGATQGRNRSRG
jgi:hypothetical protein